MITETITASEQSVTRLTKALRALESEITLLSELLQRVGSKFRQLPAESVSLESESLTKAGMMLRSISQSVSLSEQFPSRFKLAIRDIDINIPKSLINCCIPSLVRKEPTPIQSANSAYGGDMQLQLRSIENKLMKF